MGVGERRQGSRGPPNRGVWALLCAAHTPAGRRHTARRSPAARPPRRSAGAATPAMDGRHPIRGRRLRPACWVEAAVLLVAAAAHGARADMLVAHLPPARPGPALAAPWGHDGGDWSPNARLLTTGAAAAAVLAPALPRAAAPSLAAAHAPDLPRATALAPADAAAPPGSSPLRRLAVAVDDFLVASRTLRAQKHKPLLPLDQRDIVALGVAVICLLLAAGSGIGGGAALVPICLVILGARRAGVATPAPPPSPRPFPPPVHPLQLLFSPTPGFPMWDAVALSNVTICGGAIASFAFNAPRRRREPGLDRPLIDWDVILVCSGGAWRRVVGCGRGCER